MIYLTEIYTSAAFMHKL